MCGVGGVVAVLGAEFGTSVLVGGFWLYVAARLHSAAPDRSHQTKSYPSWLSRRDSTQSDRSNDG